MPKMHATDGHMAQLTSRLEYIFYDQMSKSPMRAFAKLQNKAEFKRVFYRHQDLLPVYEGLPSTKRCPPPECVDATLILFSTKKSLSEL